MKRYDDILKGGDLRSIGKANEVAKVVVNQNDFDQLFKYLFHKDRKVVMRTADAIEKITLKRFGYLTPHKKDILRLCSETVNIELKWHLALLLSRLELTEKELGQVWQFLTMWATDKNEAKIVRVNSVQSLFNIFKTNNAFKQDFNFTIDEIMKENIPSLNARIRKIKNAST